MCQGPRRGGRSQVEAGWWQEDPSGFLGLCDPRGGPSPVPFSLDSGLANPQISLSLDFLVCKMQLGIASITGSW